MLVLTLAPDFVDASVSDIESDSIFGNGECCIMKIQKPPLGILLYPLIALDLGLMYS